MDTGFNSEANRRILQGAGTPSSSASGCAPAARATCTRPLKRAGRYKTLESGLRVKEVITHKGSVAARGS
jgi:hypothetical protein